MARLACVAGGTRIARATNFEHQLLISGQVCGNCGWQWYQFNFTNLGGLSGRTIQAGDSLRWVNGIIQGARAVSSSPIQTELTPVAALAPF